MRVLITGAASFLGRHLVEHFLSKDEEVLALVRENARGKDELLKYEKNNISYYCISPFNISLLKC